MLAGGPFGLGLPELLVILAVFILIFGVNKVGDLGGAVGKSVREFRRASHEDEPPAPASTESTNNSSISSAAATPPIDTATPATTARFCTNCGAQVDAGAKFCAQCGTPVQATVS